jgi:hypothetical protein
LLIINSPSKTDIQEYTPYINSNNHHPRPQIITSLKSPVASSYRELHTEGVMSDNIKTSAVTGEASVPGHVLGVCDIATVDGAESESEEAKAAEETQRLGTKDDEGPDHHEHDDHGADADAESNESVRSRATDNVDSSDSQGVWYIEAGCGRLDSCDKYGGLNSPDDEDDVFLQNVIFLAKAWVRQLRESGGVDSPNEYSLCVEVKNLQCTFFVMPVWRDEAESEKWGGECERERRGRREVGKERRLGE